MAVRTRIAPSPTGFAHVGTAYTALFNYAYAQKSGGEFLLRVEDTDQKRNVSGGVEAIEEGLSWLGISWHGDIVKQSDRRAIYEKYAVGLLEKGAAYRDGGGIILKVDPKVIYWDDVVRGKIEFPEGQTKDFPILKSDGYPAYNFAVVVDDHEMGISHVIRGEDHISNTPRQLAVYQALDWEPPSFAHFPLLRNTDKSKMSKRGGDVAISGYKDKGFLPNALLNYLALLGWSHPEGKEIFSLEEFVENFTLERIKTSAPIFDVKKLEWMNGQYTKQLSISKFQLLIGDFYAGKYDMGMIGQTFPLVRERLRTLKDYEELAGFFYERPTVDTDIFGANYKKHLEIAFDLLSSVQNWGIGEVNERLEKVVTDESVHTGQFFMDLRVVITGKKVTPPLNDSLAILGKDETLARIKKFL